MTEPYIINCESKKNDIKLLSLDELKIWLSKVGEKKFNAMQIYKWIYQKQCDNFDAMTDLSQKLRNILNKTFYIRRLEIRSVQSSIDGSKKYVFNLSDGNIIESLLIPEKNHFTLCISSQVGCAQKCKFCMTGKDGLIRNLFSNEIVSQILDIQKEVKNKSRLPLSNIVFMGMGEPLANYKQILRALKIISDGNYGLKISQRRITVSTAGLVPKIKLLGLDTKVNLAISLNATSNKIRNILMPINKIYSINTLIDVCRAYPLKKRQKITFEYVIIKGINDNESDAKRLATMLNRIRAKINIIPFNEHNGCKYKRPSNNKILKFQKYLMKKNYTVVIRYSKGEDIMGACGQLRSRHTKQIKSYF